MSSPIPDRQAYVLGLDIGANSIGWAAVAIRPDGKPTGFLNPPSEIRTRPTLGVRIFDEGVEHYGFGEREVGRGQKRRLARLQRRQTMRRARRIAKTFRILQEIGLIPAVDPDAVKTLGRSAARDAVVKRLDEQLSRALAGANADRAAEIFQNIPYVLRAEGLDRPLSAHELGRALFHLAQRRGFLSNRKAGKKDDDVGAVKKGINELSKAMVERASRTLGEHLLREIREGRRARARWTARSMYVDEFEKLWAAQARHHTERLTDDAKRRLTRAIFFQRPLRSQRDLIGGCELECGDEYVNRDTGEFRRTRRRRRAPECLLISQRFRLLQAVNNMAVEVGDGLPAVPLDDDQKKRLADELEVVPKLKFAQAATALGLKKGTRFNLQAGGEKELRGNQTNAQLLTLFGDRWRALSDEKRDRVVLELWGAPNDETIVRRAKARNGVWSELRPTAIEADQVSSVVLSSEYMSLSRHAMRELLPLLERGLPYMTAVRTVYGERVRHESVDRLAPVNTVLGTLRNPSVMRALTELRRVVNHLLAAYGRPEEIRVELARDLKKSKDDRNRIIRQNRDLEEVRRKAAERAMTEGQLTDVRPGDILRVQLANECGWVCPYSGQSFGMSQLLGGDLDIEHIIPYSLCLDDSFLNKTLCLAHVNRNEKRNRSPYEAFGHDQERWSAMVARMERNSSEHGMHKAKLERFQLSGDAYKQAIEQFKSSQLNDTRYASRAAKEYLATLYGGNLAQGTDAAGQKRILVGNGQATALVRRQLGMEGVLRRTKGWPTSSGVDWDKRADHRHHAMDAVAIALTGQGMLQSLARAAEGDGEARRRAIGRLEAPWDSFEDELHSCLDDVVISFRIDNRARGPLHAETIYSPRRDELGRRASAGAFSHKRKPIDQLTRREFEDIVDPRIRATVSAFFGDREPAKVCKVRDDSTYPALVARDGQRVPVRRVRLRKDNSTFTVGAGHRAREVANDSNHHVLVRDVVDRRGVRKVAFELVPMIEAVRRRSAGEPIILRDDGVLFTLIGNDIVELCDDDRESHLFRVRTITAEKVEGCWITDARPKIEIKKAKAWVTVVPSRLSPARGSRKLAVSPIGVVRPCRA